MRPFVEDLRREFVSVHQLIYTLDIPLPTEKGRRELFKINLRDIKISEDNGGIDWERLIKETDGYSGADVTCVCRDAAMMPMRRKLMCSNFDIMNINSMQDEIDVPLTMQDFLEAIKNISKSVSQE
jgi:katanin p60 ATPase-containing subunit A1